MKCRVVEWLVVWKCQHIKRIKFYKFRLHKVLISLSNEQLIITWWLLSLCINCVKILDIFKHDSNWFFHFKPFIWSSSSTGLSNGNTYFVTLLTTGQQMESLKNHEWWHRICTLAEMTRDGQERKIAFWWHPKMSKNARGMGSSLVEADEQLEWQKYVLNTTAHHLGRNCCSSTSTKDVPYIGMWPFNGLPRKLN